MSNRVLMDGCISMHTYRHHYSSTASTPCVVMTQVQHETHQLCTVHLRSRVQCMDGWCAMGLTARERSLAKGERSQTIHLAGVRGSPPTCSMSLGSTHSTAVKGRSSTLTRTGRVLPPICITKGTPAECQAVLE